MKKVFLTVFVLGFFLSPFMAFADTDFSLGHSYNEPAMMIFLGFGLLALAEIGKDMIKR